MEDKIELERNIERGIKLLASAEAINTKPTILHSVKVALLLQSFGYFDEIVLAGLLHDAIEDFKGITIEDIVVEFVQVVGDIVRATSFDPVINERLQREIDTFERCRKLGMPAMIVKCADLIDNIDYYACSSDENQKYLLEKYAYFIK